MLYEHHQWFNDHNHVSRRIYDSNVKYTIVWPACLQKNLAKVQVKVRISQPRTSLNLIAFFLLRALQAVDVPSCTTPST